MKFYPDPPEQFPKSRTGRGTAIFTYLPLGLAAVLFSHCLYVAMVLPSESVGMGGAEGIPLSQTISVDRWEDYLFKAILILFPATLAASLWYTLKGKRFGATSLLVALISPCLYGFGVVRAMPGHVKLATARSPDGSEYALLGLKFFQGSYLALGRLSRRTLLRDYFDVVVDSPWESSRGFLTIVRPRGFPEEEGLYLTPDGIVVGVTHNNQAYVAYDRARGRLFGPVERSYASSLPIEDLSPFLLLDSDDTPMAADFDQLLGRKRGGRPNARAIQADLNHPNLRVREMAVRLLQDLKKNPPIRDEG